VLELEIHRRAKPDAFTQASLNRLIGLNDRLAVMRLASLQVSARSALMELDDGSLKRLARALDEQQLDSLARYVTGLDRVPAQRLLRTVVETPARMRELSPPSVREAVLSSRDQAAAVGMMLQTAALPDPGAVLAHTRLVLDGRISPLLLWVKHAWAIVAAGVVLMALLLIAKRLLFPARRIVVTLPDARDRARTGRG